MPNLVEKALNAVKETKQIEFKREFDTTSLEQWCGIIKDVVAIANSGGGIILIGINNDGSPSGADVSSVLILDLAEIADKIYSYTNTNFSDIEILSLAKTNLQLAAFKIGPAKCPLIFIKPGTYPIPGNRQNTAFGRGTIFFRHGAKSETGDCDDLRQVLERRLREIRKEWEKGVAKVIRAPEGSSVTMLPPEVVHSTSPTATPIRIVDYPSAPAFGLIDHNLSHPYRQIDVKNRLGEIVPALASLNHFDFQAVRKVHGIEGQEKFFYRPKFSSPQYSEEYVQWLKIHFIEDSEFFNKAKEQYQALQNLQRHS
jgi:hypothetical protein